MTRGTPVDQAFDRYQVLSRLIELEQRRARDNPQNQRYLDLGITEPGDTKSEAAQKIAETLDGLAKMLMHAAILDMASAFERYCLSKIDNKVAAVRRLIKHDAGDAQASSYASKFLRNSEDFRGLRSILGLIEDVLEKRVIDAAKLVRDSRNAFAHGTDLQVPPAVEPTQARDNLNEIASHL